MCLFYIFLYALLMIKQQHLLALYIVIGLLGKSTISLSMENNNEKREAIKDFPPLNRGSPFLCRAAANSSLPSVQRNVRMPTCCYHQCPYLPAAGAHAQKIHHVCTSHQSTLYGLLQQTCYQAINFPIIKEQQFSIFQLIPLE